MRQLLLNTVSHCDSVMMAYIVVSHGAKNTVSILVDLGDILELLTLLDDVAR